MTDTTSKAVGIAILVLLAGCSGIGGTGQQDSTSEPIAQINSVSTEKVEGYCGFEYNISKQEGVMIQLKKGVTSQFAGNGEYFMEQETQLENWIIVEGGSGKPIKINAYETPTNGTGKSLQLWNGTVTEGCAIEQ